MDVEASPSTLVLEAATTRTMIERVEANHDVWPWRLMGDTAYGTAENLDYLVEEKGIEPHIPVWDKTSRKNGIFSVSDFKWDELTDEYRCPADRPLQRNLRNFKVPRTGITKANTILYRSRKANCKFCPLKQRCCPNTPHRKIARSIHEKSRDVARAICKSDEYIQTSCNERKKVEVQFAHMKSHLRFDRLRFRGIKSYNDEFLLVATAQNLRRMAKLRGQPPPDRGVSTPVIPKMA